ncbi:hypothetical protein HYW59_01660 [Candidatus Kaiserbacteria bacterium]|nr:hypothetical protein [Candidatus Kaiserbacteria bacterium]
MTKRVHRHDPQWSDETNAAIAHTPESTTVIVSIGIGPLPSMSKGSSAPEWIWFFPSLWFVPLTEG